MTTSPHPSTLETLAVKGRTRTMRVLGAPAEQAAPVVLLLHGSKQTGDKLRAFTGNAFDRLAAGGALVAYLDGFKEHWNDARVSNAFAARTEGYDDVAFARSAIERIIERYNGDPARVYAVGFSNGGQMVIRLIHEIPDLLAGAAVISATQPAAENFAPTDPQSQPVPVMLVHGTKDPLVPYNGGMASMWGFKPRGLGLSAPETARYYAQRNGIGGAPVTEDLVPAKQSRTSVQALHYRDPGHAPVSLYTVTGGGHTIPGTRKAPFVMGRTDMTFDTVAAVATFFHLPISNQDSA
ncbi:MULTISPECIES: alpha/beta hydrolase family esterase [unclassified Streptomyces]|uniref:alpha/beta hydrolase family esterase n=1 Tax=unclassified Streptomyces TaxID=2593676 RepID=UPI000F6DF1BD|nr:MULTISPECIES: PHB depolymerase family esterase [unclassified Streptomyces]AZM64496.1 hypothetical protein DLM49_10765 [Streptomyces sp. WAC 01438]RSM99913.1 hypothetical protein DMA10_05770 [Streptomyces sp. WAC 01420]